jgi:hypothetical protein
MSDRNVTRHSQHSKAFIGGLCTNFLEISLNKTEATVWRTLYSKEKLDNFKKGLPNYSFYRYTNSERDWIYAWPTKETSSELPSGFTEISITVEIDAPVFAKIIEESIVSFFKTNNYTIFKKKYSSIWEIHLTKEERKFFGALQLIPVLNFSIHTLYSKIEEKQVLTLSIQAEKKHKFIVSEEELNTDSNIDTRTWTRNRYGQIVASSHNKRLYLEATNQTEVYDSYVSIFQSDKHQYLTLTKYRNNFNSIKSRIYLPDSINIESLLFSNLPNSKFNSEKINKPKYYYYNERTGSGYYNTVVSRLKPYSYNFFQNKTVKILVVTPNEHEGTVGEFLFKQERNIKNLFHLHELVFEKIVIQNKPDEYVNALKDFDLTGFDLAIVVMEEKYKQLPIEVSPYHRTKAKLLNQRIVSQDILIHKIKNTNMSIENNISLNIYSKIGGTAWTIERTEKDIPELIIGIGSTVDRDGNTIIGFANIFDHNGTYLVGDCSQLSTKENYAKSLEIYLIKAVREAIEIKGISTGERVRLIFHIYKGAAEKYEIKAINNTLREFALYSIQYGIAHLSYNHNFRIYLNEGCTTPERGTFIQISTRQAIIHFGGDNGTPLLIQVDRRSNYIDLYSMTKQILFFCHLSYRSFKPANEPVTISYPRRMAKIVSELKQLSNWDSDILNTLSDKLWFI